MACWLLEVCRIIYEKKNAEKQNSLLTKSHAFVIIYTAMINQLTSQQTADAAIDSISGYLAAGNREAAYNALLLFAPHISYYYGESVYNDLYTLIFSIDTNAIV